MNKPFSVKAGYFSKKSKIESIKNFFTFSLLNFFTNPQRPNHLQTFLISG